MTEAPPTPQVDEKDLIINELREENQRLNADLGLLKDRVKTINNYLQSAQEGIYPAMGECAILPYCFTYFGLT